MLLIGCAYFNTYYNAQSYFDQGMRLVTNDTLKYDSEFFDKTIEKATYIIVKYPRSRWVDDALLLMGISYYYKGDYLRSLEKLDLYCLNYPESKNYLLARYYKGLAHFKEQKYSNAILSLTETLGSKKLKKKALFALCYINAQEGNYNGLVETSSSLSKERLRLQEKIDVLTILGEAQFKLGQYENSLATFNYILSLCRVPEEKKKLKLRIAEIYLELKQYEDCKKFLEGEAAAEFRMILANLNIEIGNVDIARQIYQEVINEGRTEFISHAFHELARLYELADSVDQAIAFYDSASIKSGDEYSQKAKKKSEILKRVTSLERETKDVDRAQFLLAELYFVDLNDVNKALLTYKKVYTNHPGSQWAPKAYYADLWITKNVLKDDTLALLIGQELMTKYPSTEYAMSAEKILSTQNPLDNDTTKVK